MIVHLEVEAEVKQYMNTNKCNIKVYKNKLKMKKKGTCKYLLPALFSDILAFSILVYLLVITISSVNPDGSNNQIK